MTTTVSEHLHPVTKLVKVLSSGLLQTFINSHLSVKLYGMSRLLTRKHKSGWANKQEFNA